jgi:hypothetical protein
MSERERDVVLGGWEPEEEPEWASFPGPAGAEAHLRVALEGEAYAGVVAHARQRAGWARTSAAPTCGSPG